MVKVTSERVQRAIHTLPPRLLDEWEDICRYYSPNSDEHEWDTFQQTWAIDSLTVQEILQVSETINTEWKYYRDYVRVYGKVVDLEKTWQAFKHFWNLDCNSTKQVFKEMEHLSEGMLYEWRLKYTYQYPLTYEHEDYTAGTIDYTKSKSQLWHEFKQLWKLDMDNYNEDKYIAMKCVVERGLQKADWRAFQTFKTCANYHSFDEYSMLDQYKIWCDFINE